MRGPPQGALMDKKKKEEFVEAMTTKRKKPAKPKPNVEGRIYRLKILMGKTTNQITYGVYKKELEELEKGLKG